MLIQVLVEEGDEDEADSGVTVAPDILANDALPSMTAAASGHSGALPSSAASATVAGAASESRAQKGASSMAGAGANASLASDGSGTAGSHVGGGIRSNPTSAAAPLLRKPKRAAFMSTGAAEKPPPPSSIPEPLLYTGRGFDDAGSDRCMHVYFASSWVGLF